MREHHQQHRYPHPRCLPPSQLLHHIRCHHHKLFRNTTRTLLASIHHDFLFRGICGLTGNGNSSGSTDRQLTQYPLETNWSPQAGSHCSQTLQGIARLDYQLWIYILYSIHFFSISDEFVLGKDVSMTNRGYVEEWSWKFPHSEVSIPYLVSSLISFKSHLLPIDFIKVNPSLLTMQKNNHLGRKLPKISVFIPSPHKVLFVVSMVFMGKHESWNMKCFIWYDWVPLNTCVFYVDQ